MGAGGESHHAFTAHTFALLLLVLNQTSKPAWRPFFTLTNMFWAIGVCHRCVRGVGSWAHTCVFPSCFRSSYFVGVDEDLISGLSGANLNRVILPYVSDGMTQVLACCDPLDANGWDKWPSKISTWNYGLWFPTAKAGGDEKLLIDGDGKKWFLVTYDIVGCELGKGVGRVQVYDWADEKKLASTGHFGALCRK